MTLNRAQILAGFNFETVEVPAPEWDREGEPARVRGMNAWELVTYQDQVRQAGINQEDVRTMDGHKIIDLLVTIVICCVVDDNGANVFTEADRDWLRKNDVELLQRIRDVAYPLSGLEKKQEEGDDQKN